MNVKATGAGLTATASKAVTVQQPKVSMRVVGPTQRYVGQQADWKIFVEKNERQQRSRRG